MDLSAIGAKLPLLEPIVERAAAVVTHSNETFERVKALGSMPVHLLPLPFVMSASSLRSTVKARMPGPLRLIIFGHLSLNRRLESVLRALRNIDCVNDFRLSVFGTLWDEVAVSRMIAESGLGAIVELCGFVDDHVLDRAIENADLAINLRWPSMGESSLSQLRIWSHAKPAMVTRGVWRGSIPEGTAIFIDPENEVTDIQRGLASLRANPQGFNELGMRGYRYLCENHRVDIYVERLLKIFAEFQGLERHYLSRRLAVICGQNLGELGGTAVSSEALAYELASTIDEL
jgi:glycosyltransferase involved in cell wall biosynthesis